jgi:hypothetical protein
MSEDFVNKARAELVHVSKRHDYWIDHYSSQAAKENAAADAIATIISRNLAQTKLFQEGDPSILQVADRMAENAVAKFDLHSPGIEVHTKALTFSRLATEEAKRVKG